MSFFAKKRKIGIDKIHLIRYNNFRSERCGSSSVVECHLAKVDVASPNLVYRSMFERAF